MKNDWEFELKALQSAQEDLHRRLETLDQRMAQLRERMKAEEAEVMTHEPEKHGQLIEPSLPNKGRAVSMTPPLLDPAPVQVEPPAPPISHEPHGLEAPFELNEPSVSNEARAVSPTPPLPSSEPAEGLEMKVGKYWLVRIGILVLLTGLVLLGNLA